MQSKFFTPYTPKQQNKTKVSNMSPIISQQDIHLESLYLPDAFPYYFIVLVISESTPGGKQNATQFIVMLLFQKMDNGKGNRSWTTVTFNITTIETENQNWIKLK